MLDFAKSIVCNTKSEVANVGNASGIKEFNTEADLRRWCIEHQYTYTPTHGGYYRLEDDKPGRNRSDLEAHVKAGNKKVGNSYQYAGSIPIEKIPDNWRPEFPKAGYIVYYAPNKAKWFATETEAKRFADSQDKAQKTGNSKVGNAGVDQAEAREFQQSLKPIKGFIEDAGVAVYGSPREAISHLQKAKQEIDKAISWAKNL